MNDNDIKKINNKILEIKKLESFIGKIDNWFNQSQSNISETQHDEIKNLKNMMLKDISILPNDDKKQLILTAYHKEYKENQNKPKKNLSDTELNTMPLLKKRQTLTTLLTQHHNALDKNKIDMEIARLLNNSSNYEVKVLLIKIDLKTIFFDKDTQLPKNICSHLKPNVLCMIKLKKQGYSSLGNKDSNDYKRQQYCDEINQILLKNNTSPSQKMALLRKEYNEISKKLKWYSFDSQKIIAGMTQLAIKEIIRTSDNNLESLFINTLHNMLNLFLDGKNNTHSIKVSRMVLANLLKTSSSLTNNPNNINYLNTTVKFANNKINNGDRKKLVKIFTGNYSFFNPIPKIIKDNFTIKNNNIQLKSSVKITN